MGDQRWQSGLEPTSTCSRCPRREFPGRRRWRSVRRRRRRCRRTERSVGEGGADVQRKLAMIVGLFAILVGMMGTVAVARPRAVGAQATTPVTAALAPTDAPIYAALNVDRASKEWLPADAPL